jgi:hypothetical protein
MGANYPASVCPVCYEMVSSSLSLLPCGHALCFSCQHRTEPKLCPLCRAAFNVPAAVLIPVAGVRPAPPLVLEPNWWQRHRKVILIGGGMVILAGMMYCVMKDGCDPPNCFPSEL